jgi:hypothetical protein
MFLLSPPMIVVKFVMFEAEHVPFLMEESLTYRPKHL